MVVLLHFCLEQVISQVIKAMLVTKKFWTVMVLHTLQEGMKLNGYHSLKHLA